MIIVLQVLKTSALHNNIRPRVVDLSFIVTPAHQKIKTLFCRINFDYTTVLSAYVKNQAIIEPILLYRASKCKQT